MLKILIANRFNRMVEREKEAKFLYKQYKKLFGPNPKLKKKVKKIKKIRKESKKKIMTFLV